LKFYHVTNREAWKAIKEEGVLFSVHGDGDWSKRNTEKNSGYAYRYTYLSPKPLLGYGNVVLQVEFTPKQEDFGKVHNYGFDPPPGQICTQFSVFKPIPLSDVKFCFWYSVMTIFHRTYWKFRNHPFVDRIINIFTQCPDCKGAGGEKDIICDDGTGPWYDCGFCDGKGYMNVFKKLYLKILLAIYDKLKKRYPSFQIP
jgi:hypothetical protein